MQTKELLYSTSQKVVCNAPLLGSAIGSWKKIYSVLHTHLLKMLISSTQQSLLRTERNAVGVIKRHLLFLEQHEAALAEKSSISLLVQRARLFSLNILKRLCQEDAGEMTQEVPSHLIIRGFCTLLLQCQSCECSHVPAISFCDTELLLRCHLLKRCLVRATELIRLSTAL